MLPPPQLIHCTCFSIHSSMHSLPQQDSCHLPPFRQPWLQPPQGAKRACVSPQMTGSFFCHLLTCIAVERERGQVDGTAVRTWFWLHTIHILHIPVQCESDKSENIHACKTCRHFPCILASLVLEIIPSWLYASSMHLQVRDILHVSTQHAYRQ